MERLRRAVQRRPGRHARGLAGFLGLGVAGVLCVHAGTSYAQTAPPAPADAASPAEIVAARELFRQGTEDADAGRYADGLEKFRRVAAVKETGAVRFNIARCEEALGRTGAALADFELAARDGRDDAKAGDVTALAGQRADALRPKVPRLTVVVPSPAPDGMSVSLDGGKLANATLGVALPVDPGSHVLEAKATGRSPFRAEITVADGDAKRLEVALPVDPAAPTTDVATSAPQSSQPRWGWITLATGGALAVGSGLFLVLHNNAVSTLGTDCPGQRCPSSQQSQIESTESNARAYEGVSIGLVAASAIAIGAGIVLLATAPKAGAASVTVSAGAPAAPAGLSLHGSF